MAWWVSVQWWGDDRQVSQSGKPLCTGASLWAVPKLARGLCPLEPRHVNGVSIPAKCPPDIPTEHLLMDDLAECLGGQANYRGGKFEPSLFAFYSYNWFKNVTIATADGRKSESALSRGVNPSESTENINIAALLDAIKTMDYTKYPGGAVIYMDIPLMYKTPQPSLFASVMRAFCENGGSIMDFNVISRNALLEAQKNPETHKNIVVRVCGYSAYFHTLTAEMQNEVIQRTQR